MDFCIPLCVCVPVFPDTSYSHPSKNGIAQGTNIFQYCTCPAGRVTYNFYSSCKCMHLTFKSICNKEYKGVICNMTSLSNSSQITRPTGRVLWEALLNYSSFLDFTRNYERTSWIFVPCIIRATPCERLTVCSCNYE